MWRQLILFLVFCFFLSFLKVCGAYEWVPGTVGSYNTGDWQKMAGMYSTALPGFDGWLWAAYCRNSLETDSKGFVKGKFEVGGLMYCVAYAVRVSSSDDEIRLQYHENSSGEGFYLFNTVTKELANLELADCQKFDCIALYMSSAGANGRVPLNPGARLNIFDYAYSMPRTDARIGFQSSNYRDFFKRCQVQGLQTGESVTPDTIDINYTGSQWFPCARIFTTSDFSAFITEQLRRLSDSYDSDGGGLADQNEWDSSDHSSLVYYWNDPEDDVQYLPGVQQVEVIPGGNVDLDPPPFEGPPSFQMPEGFDLGPESSDWVQKVTDSVEAVREKLEPLRGRFLPLFNDLEKVDPVLRVQFSSDNKTGFVSSIPIDFSFDFSGQSLGSSVASSLHLIRSVLVVLIFAVVLWIMIRDITKKEGSNDD